MTTDPFVLQHLVRNHQRDLVEAAEQSRLRNDLAVNARAARPHMAWRGWLRRSAAVRTAAAH